MRALTFWKTIIVDETGFLEALLELFEKNGIRFCVVGGQAVNAYVEPVVSLDLDVAVATDQIEQVESLLAGPYRVQRFPHSVNISAEGSDLRVQIQTDPRYADFLEHSGPREVLGAAL